MERMRWYRMTQQSFPRWTSKICRSESFNSKKVKLSSRLDLKSNFHVFASFPSFLPSFHLSLSTPNRPPSFSCSLLLCLLDSSTSRIWIACSEVGDGNAVLGRGLNIDLVSYRPSLNRLSPAGGFNQPAKIHVIILRLSFRSVASSLI